MSLASGLIFAGIAGLLAVALWRRPQAITLVLALAFVAAVGVAALLPRDARLLAPIVLDLALFLDLAHRAGQSGVQEWLSFYWKSPQPAGGVSPEHDIFIQQTKLKNTLRQWMGEEAVTHSEAE